MDRTTGKLENDKTLAKPSALVLWLAFFGAFGIVIVALGLVALLPEFQTIPDQN